MYAHRIQHSGAIEVAALVTDGIDEWREHETYYGYTKREARRRFAAHLRERGLERT